jgi:hypothetical protein
MEVLGNANKSVRNDLATTITKGDKLSITAACFEQDVTDKLIRGLAARRKQLEPLTSRVVFRDDLFTSSPHKINLFEKFKLLAPNASVRVI